MGIQGLLPFLEKSSRKVNVSEFSGCTVAVDAYCWLHKGAFSCAEKLARKEDTVQYVLYCMKYINMLLSHNIKPILVFDGQHLPAKAETEKVRRERRELNRQKAAELLRADRGDEAKTYLRRCVDVTHAMALALIKACRMRNVDCIVAPYEADAQLAYLSISGIAHLVITEDSDLIPFGCSMVLFKMDVLGNGVLIEQSMLPLAMKQRPEQFSLKKFRYMCILSGCDYLPSLPGIGLVKARKFITTTVDPDISKALTRLHGHLNMPNLVVTPEYRQKFLEADAMFRHQPVFDPLSRRLVPLTPFEPGEEELLHTGALSLETALQLAYGNLDPFSLKKVDNWDPDSTLKSLKGGKNWQVNRAPHKSIWSEDYSLPKPLPPKKDPREQIIRPSTKHKQLLQSVDSLKEKMRREPASKRASEGCEEQLGKLREMFSVNNSPPQKKACLEIIADNDGECIDFDELIGDSRSPIGKGNVATRSAVNPFVKSVSPHKPAMTSPPPVEVKRSSFLSRLSKIKKTVLDEKSLVKSRYFKSSGETTDVATAIEKKSLVSHDLISSTAGGMNSPPSSALPRGAVETSDRPLSTRNKILDTDSPKKATPPTLNSQKIEPQVTPTSSVKPRNIFAVSSVVNQESDLEWVYKKEESSFLNLVDNMGRIENTEENVSMRSMKKSGSFKWSKSLLDSESTENLLAMDQSFIEPVGDDDGAGGCTFPDTPPSSQGTPPSFQSSISKYIIETIPRARKTLLVPARRVGLSKRKSSTPLVNKSPKESGPRQTSLLEKFGFQPKSKLRL